MSTIESQVKLAAKLYKCRDTAKQLYKQEYHAKMREYQEYIKAAMVKYGLDELPAVMKMIKEGGSDINGMTVVLLLSATIEMIEPSDGGM